MLKPWLLSELHGRTQLLFVRLDVEDANLLELLLTVQVQQLDDVLPEEAVPACHHHRVALCRHLQTTKCPDGMNEKQCEASGVCENPSAMSLQSRDPKSFSILSISIKPILGESPELPVLW